jgi:hypothetical protein
MVMNVCCLLARIKLNKPTITNQSTNSAMDGLISIIFRTLLFIILFMKLLHVIFVLVIVCIGHIIFWEEGALVAILRGDGMTSDK